MLKANLALILAVPDLLEAAKGVLGSFEDDMLGWDSLTYLQFEALEKLRNLVRKIEGN